jgi:adenosylcobyric acid synthase
MGLARAADLPVIVVGDIDRGGVFAAMYGTLALLDAEDQALVSGFVINKFRGAPELLTSGITMLTQLTGRPVIGVLPWRAGLGIDTEDSLALDAYATHSTLGQKGFLKVAVVRLPRISNFTDVDALAAEPGVLVRFVDTPLELNDADLVILPGSRATVADLAWLRERGLADAISQCDKPVLGVCAGYQMLATEIDDPVESGAGLTKGLGLLPVRTRFEHDKTLNRPASTAYEIRHGVTEGGDESFPGGCRRGVIRGTSWHGIMEDNEFRRAFLAEVAAESGRDFTPAPDTDFAMIRENRLDVLGDLVADNLDTTAISALIERGAPRGLPSVVASLQRDG